MHGTRGDQRYPGRRGTSRNGARHEGGINGTRGDGERVGAVHGTRGDQRYPGRRGTSRSGARHEGGSTVPGETGNESERCTARGGINGTRGDGERVGAVHGTRGDQRYPGRRGTSRSGPRHEGGSTVPGEAGNESERCTARGGINGTRGGGERVGAVHGTRGDQRYPGRRGTSRSGARHEGGINGTRGGGERVGTVHGTRGGSTVPGEAGNESERCTARGGDRAGAGHGTRGGSNGVERDGTSGERFWGPFSTLCSTMTETLAKCAAVWLRVDFTVIFFCIVRTGSSTLSRPAPDLPNGERFRHCAVQNRKRSPNVHRFGYTLISQDFFSP